MSNQKHEIIFPDASLNFDDDKRLMPPAHSDFKLNIIKNEGGRHGLITNIKGNERLTGQIQIRGSEVKCIGSCYDIKRRAIIYFIYAVDAYEGYHSIIMYELDSDMFKAILFEQPVLQFSLDYPIMNSFVIGDTLCWTDGNREPRAINIDLAIAYTEGKVIPSIPSGFSISEGD